MYISKEHLQTNLGVDADIAAFFVDRKVPENNRYWKGRYLYISRGTGYMFIPLFFDIQFRCGVRKEIILNEEYVQLMEKILDSAGLHEFEQISFHEHLENCKALISNRIKNEELYKDLLEYFKNDDLMPYKNFGTTSKALNRGDTFLFTLCVLDLSKDVTNKIIEEWYALIPSFLLMDDIMDLSEDQQKNAENSIKDFGQGNTGVERAIEFLRQKFNHLKDVNNKLGEYFENSLERKLQTPYL